MICCQEGKVKLPLQKEPPQFLKSLHQENPRFRDNIRAYNSMFAFTSMGGKVDTNINKGRGPYVFRINGQNYHKIGTLVPVEGQMPKFAQLYIMTLRMRLQTECMLLGATHLNVL